MAQDKINQVKNALKLWRDLEDKYFDYGVGDTEPNQAFQVVIKRIVKGEEIDWAFFDNNGWCIYSSMPGWKAVCKAMSARSRKIGKKIKSIINNACYDEGQSCIDYLKDEFHRIDWDYTHNNGRM